MSPASQLPARARVVVVGGGVIGCSIAYHLSALGRRRRRPPRAQRAHLRHHVARRRSDHQRGHGRRDVAVDGALLARPLRRLEDETGPLHRVPRRSATSTSPRRPSRLETLRRESGVQRAVRRRQRRDLRRRGRRAVAADRGRRRPRGFVRRDEGRAEPGRRHDVAGRRAPRRAGSRIVEDVDGDRLRARSDGRVIGVRTDARRRRVREGRAGRRAVGRASWAPRPASTSRCRPPSTTTCSPSRSRACTATCR